MSKPMRRIATILLSTSLMTACGEDATNNDVVADAGGSLEDDAGTDADTPNGPDAGVVECSEDEFEIDGECLLGSLDVRLVGSADRVNSATGFISWAADTSPDVETIDVTPTCAYGELIAEGSPAPSRPDCLSAGTITLSSGAESETITDEENCYDAPFQMIREWGGEEVEVNLAGGSDFDATQLTLAIPEAPRFLSPGGAETDVVLTRTNPEQSDDPIILILPDGAGPVLQCTETSPGELRLSSEDVAAIQALEGQHTTAFVAHSNFEYVIDPPYFFNVSVQNQTTFPDFLPPE